DMTELRDRHWFYLRHRRPFVIAWSAAALPLGYLILFRVPPPVRTDDVVLCLIGIGYFLLIHHRCDSDRFSKELFVGFLFSIATAVPTWTRLHHERGLLLAAMLTFGAACWLNCVAIQTWEDAEASRENVEHPFADPAQSEFGTREHTLHRRALTQFLGNHLTAFAIAIAILAFSLASLPAARSAWPLFIAVGASALVFVALIHRNLRVSALSLRVLADGALLTPLVFFLYLR
ncbi:MAG: hypothetical protein V4587_00735, partial [Acidobacteriota bacterium]